MPAPNRNMHSLFLRHNEDENIKDTQRGDPFEFELFLSCFNERKQIEDKNINLISHPI